MQGVLLCGALNDGLGPVEQMRHVPTLPVANVPLLNYAIGLLRHTGVDDLTVNVNHGAGNVARAVAGLAVDGLQTRLSFEYHLTGSANVLHRLHARPTAPFLVMMGDTFFADLDFDALRQAHREAGAIATVVASPRGQSHPAYGRLIANGHDRLTGILKEDAGDTDDALVNTGLYLFEPGVIDFVPTEQRWQLGHDLLPALIAAGQTVLVQPGGGYYQRVNSFRQFWTLSRDLASGLATPRYALPGGFPSLGTEALAHVSIDPSAKLDGPVVLDEGVRIERDVIITGPAVIGRDVTIRRGTRLNEVVVLPKTEIGLAARFERAVIFGEHLVSAEDQVVERVADRSLLRSTERRPLVDRLEQAFHSTAAALLLLLASPVLLLLALAIRLDSPGPVFYTQLRVGRRRHGSAGGCYPGRVFELYKFRSMHVDADARLEGMLAENSYQGGAFVKFKHDPRITRIGQLLRKTSLDELPQLINVVKGDMRLVGNRPLPLYEAEQMRESWQQVRFTAPAGITGLWQVSGRSDLSMEERIILDNYYAVTRNFWTDMKILVLTVPAVLLQHGSR